MFMGNWYHTYPSMVVASYLNPTSKWMQVESGVEPLADNLVLNGRYTYVCSITSTIFPRVLTINLLQCDPSESSTFEINHNAFFSFWFSIDNHTVEVVEIDGSAVQPIPSLSTLVGDTASSCGPIRLLATITCVPHS